MIHEVEDRVEVVDGDAFQVEERVQLVLIVSQDPAKQGRTGRENNLVSLDHIFPVITAQRDVEEFGILTKFPEAATDVGLEVIPPETEVFGGPHLGRGRVVDTDDVKIDVESNFNSFSLTTRSSSLFYFVPAKAGNVEFFSICFLFEE